MRAIRLINKVVKYQSNADVPALDEFYNVLVKVYYAGICRTDIGIAKGIVPAKAGIVLGHEFCGKIVGFVNDGESMDGWKLGDTVSANPMLFGEFDEMMCGKDCDGMYAEYAAVPCKALIHISSSLLNPLGAFLEPVAAALAPLSYIDCGANDRVCVFGKNRIAQLTYQVALMKGMKNVTLVCNVDELRQNYFDCIIETEPAYIDAYADALKHGGLLILKSRSFARLSFVCNTIAMKEIRIQGARYGDFNMAHQLLMATAQQTDKAIDTSRLFGKVYDLSEFCEAFAEADQPQSKKIFFKICAE